MFSFKIFYLYRKYSQFSLHNKHYGWHLAWSFPSSVCLSSSSYFNKYYEYNFLNHLDIIINIK